MVDSKCQSVDDTAPMGDFSKTTVKVDSLVMSCAECSEKYGDVLTPRILACGHSMCTPCAEKCLAGQKLCPECQEKQLAIKVTDLPINYPLLRLIRSIATEGIDISDLISPMFPEDIFCSDQQKDVWNCSAHGNPMLFFCCSCSVWVCKDCLVVDHPLLPRGSCRILNFPEAMNEIKAEHERVANQTLKDIENVKRTFKFKMDMHNFCLQHCPNDIRYHTRFIQQVESQLEELRQSNNSIVEHAKESVRKSVDSANTTTSPEEMTTSCKELLDCQRVLEKDSAKENESLIPVLQIMQEHLRLDLKLLVQGNQPVHAVLNGDKGSKWSRICIKENRLLLYCLNEGTAPKDGITIPFEYVRKLIPAEKPTIFFEVGTEEEALGRVYVRLGHDNSLTEQFTLMCSGEKGGVSYRNTYFYKYDEKDGLLKGGDYEHNNGTGGRAIVEGLADCRVYGGYSITAGSLVVDRTSTRFNFYLNSSIDRYVYDILGSVTGGLKVLKSLAKVKPVTKSMIKDCGLFIPMKSKDDSEESECQ